MKKIAVITGASSGIGREFALQIDKLNCVDEIWLVARREQRLTRLAERLDAHAKILPWDLTDGACFETYKRLLTEENARVDFLVNCAGFGKFGAVSSQRAADLDDMIRLNITATVMMCRHTVPFMLCGGKIINMASVSGSLPLPYLNVYAATKAFVYHFSRALDVELKCYGITVTAVCPYWMNTEFISVARDTPDGDAVNRFLLLYDPASVAARAIADSLMGRSESVYGAFNSLLKRTAALFPWAAGMRVWNAVRKKRADKIPADASSV